MRFVGEALGVCLALLTSLWGWVPHFTGVPHDSFLVATALAGVVFACRVR
jgi:hypothetical protein